MPAVGGGETQDGLDCLGSRVLPGSHLGRPEKSLGLNETFSVSRRVDGSVAMVAGLVDNLAGELRRSFEAILGKDSHPRRIDFFLGSECLKKSW